MSESFTPHEFQQRVKQLTGEDIDLFGTNALREQLNQRQQQQTEQAAKEGDLIAMAEQATQERLPEVLTEQLDISHQYTEQLDILRQAGKDIIVIDDSIVRGTTMRKIVQMLRNSGGLCTACFSGNYPIDLRERVKEVSHIA